jgi:hypothetical protein
MTNACEHEGSSVKSSGIRLPDVIFGGVYKAGTTFLRGYFTQHPQITWTRKAWFFQEFTYAFPSDAYPPSSSEEALCFIDMFEELTTGHIFGREINWPENYLKPGVRFADVGIRQDQEEIAGRVKETLPEAKILLVLRNQVDWMRSAYLHHMENLPRGRDTFGDFLTTPQGKLVAGASQFDVAIAAFQERFGRDRVHVMLLEELQTDQATVLQKLCRFLDVEYMPYTPVQSDRNTGKGVAVGRAVRFASRWRLDKLAKTFPSPLRKYSRRAAALLFRKDVISPQQQQLIRSFSAASNNRTARLTGLDLALFGYPL